MGLGNVSGVLSRYFVVGYWIPSLVTVFVLSVWLSNGWIPDSYEDLDWQKKGLVLGGLALVTGLALLGLRYPVTRQLEGYFLDMRALRPLRRALIRSQQVSYDRLRRVRDDDRRSASAQTHAARILDRKFHQDRDKLLPTRFGNAFRAFEGYPYTRYGLDMIAIWPRIDQLLTEQERSLHTNADSDLAFFVNGMLGALVAGIFFAADAELAWWLYLLFFALGYGLYRAAVGAVERLGTERRASIDLHRLELFERLGVSSPIGSDVERKEFARAVNRFLLWSEPVPEPYLIKDPHVDAADSLAMECLSIKPQGGGLTERLGRCLRMVNVRNRKTE
jgi:hypothetical protein